VQAKYLVPEEFRALALWRAGHLRNVIRCDIARHHQALLKQALRHSGHVGGIITWALPAVCGRVAAEYGGRWCVTTFAVSRDTHVRIRQTRKVGTLMHIEEYRWNLSTGSPHRFIQHSCFAPLFWRARYQQQKLCSVGIATSPG
jgi:phosphatidylserine/phosphatidylglycerophosphate/cardiolipin synthase-like enzyme